MNKKNTLGLRLDLVAVANTLEELIGERGAADDYPELVEIYEIIHNLRVNSKSDSFRAFDLIEKAEQCIVATTNTPDDTIHVYGHTTDNFDAELAFGILARIRKNFSEETMYMLFMKMMGGAYDNG